MRPTARDGCLCKHIRGPGLLAAGRGWGQRPCPALGFWTPGLPNCGRTTSRPRRVLRRPHGADTEHGAGLLLTPLPRRWRERPNNELRPKQTRATGTQSGTRVLSPQRTLRGQVAKPDWLRGLAVRLLICSLSCSCCVSVTGRRCLWGTHRTVAGAGGTSGPGATSGTQEHAPSPKHQYGRPHTGRHCFKYIHVSSNRGTVN